MSPAQGHCGIGPVCGRYHAAADLLCKRWSVSVVAVLVDHDPVRFNQLREAVPGITPKLLSERLRELEAAGVVERRVTASVPVLVEYRMTATSVEVKAAKAAPAKSTTKKAATGTSSSLAARMSAPSRACHRTMRRRTTAGSANTAAVRIRRRYTCPSPGQRNERSTAIDADFAEVGRRLTVGWLTAAESTRPHR